MQIILAKYDSADKVLSELLHVLSVLVSVIKSNISLIQLDDSFFVVICPFCLSDTFINK